MAGKRSDSGAKAAPKEAEILGRAPDLQVLATYSLENPEHPDWIRKEFPAYVETHRHGDSSVREFTHNGCKVRIVTTYDIEVDGEPLAAHLSVDNDGGVFTHATPFVAYASAVTLVKAIIDAYPEAFARGGRKSSGGGAGN